MFLYEVVSFMKLLKVLNRLIMLISFPLSEFGNRSSFDFVLSMLVNNLLATLFHANYVSSEK